MVHRSQASQSFTTWFGCQAAFTLFSDSPREFGNLGMPQFGSALPIGSGALAVEAGPSDSVQAFCKVTRCASLPSGCDEALPNLQ